MKKYSRNYAIKMLGFTVIALMAMLKPAFSQEPAVDNDLLTYSMAVSPDQQVKFRFPLDIRSGDMITGTVVEEKKNNAGTVNSASSSLSGTVIEIDGKQTKLSDRLISFLVPAGITSLPFLLKNAAGEIIQRGQLPVGIVSDLENPETLNGANFKPTAVCQPGQPLTISGHFDGKASTTNVSLGGQNCEVIAESGRMSIVQVSQNAVAGVSTVDIVENNISEKHKVNVAILNLSANKTTLRKGEKATITVSVSGLQGLETGNECKVTITNLSPSIVSIKGTGGNTFSQTIPQDLTTDYKSTFNIVGVTQGNYMLEGLLLCTQDSKQDYLEQDYPDWELQGLLSSGANLPSSFDYFKDEAKFRYSGSLEWLLRDLNRRKDYDYSQHGGKPGTNAAWLWERIKVIMDVLKGRGYKFIDTDGDGNDDTMVRPPSEGGRRLPVR